MELMDESNYRKLQSVTPVDIKTSSWLWTPKKIRRLGGAIFGDYRWAGFHLPQWSGILVCVEEVSGGGEGLKKFYFFFFILGGYILIKVNNLSS